MAIENTLPSPVVPQRIIHFLQNMTRVCIFDQNSVLLYLRNAHVQLHLHFWTAIQHWFKYVHLNWSSQCLQTALSNAHHFSHVKDAFTRKSSSLVTMDNPCTLHPYFKTLSCVSTPRFQRVEDQQMAALQRRRRRPLPPPSLWSCLKQSLDVSAITEWQSLQTQIGLACKSQLLSAS